MTKAPLVSVIMPAYNAEKFIQTAIESVCAQTLNDWELIVVDDGSIDRTFEIAQQIANRDHRIFVYKNPHSIGLPSAPRNYGVNLAKGRFITFLDSDDFWLPNKLKNQLPFFDFEDTAIVFSNYEKVDERGTRNGRLVIAPKLTTYRSLLLGNIIGNLTGMYDSQKVGKITIMDIHHEDYAMWLSILKKGFVARNTNTVEAIYRISDHAITSNKLQILSWQWKIYRKILHISFFSSVYYYASYALKAWVKSRI